jgi:very-short-patch-repair endonuclease
MFNLPKRSEVKTESPIEEMLLVELNRICLFPHTQYRVGNYRIDLAFPEEKIAVECDGKEWHSSQEQMKHDIERDRYLKQQGWKVMRFSGTEIYHWANQIAKAINYDEKPRTPFRSKYIKISEYDDDETVRLKMEENRIIEFEEDTKPSKLETFNFQEELKKAEAKLKRYENNL